MFLLIDFSSLPLNHIANFQMARRMPLNPAMTSYDTSASIDPVQHLRDEIEKLTQEQSEALKTATFVGMTAAEAKIYDARRRRITELVEKLRGLQNSR